MTTLVSKNEKESLNIHNAKGFTLNDGDMLILSTTNEIDLAGKWIETHGVSGIYFNPMDETKNYSEFMFVSISDESVAIRLYN